MSVSMKKLLTSLLLILLVLGAVTYLFHQRINTPQNTSGQIQIVAAENFYGDVASQIGGNKVQVLSLLSDPNADPHEYESSVSDAQAVTNANIVIENGDGYDTWMDKLLSASPSDTRIVLVGANLATDKLADNPHVWYGISNIQTIAASIAVSLEKTDPKDSSYFAANLKTFTASLVPLQQKTGEIQQKFHGIPVGLTETIYLYQTGPMQLNVLTPLAFERAIAEGNDPSADDVATSNDQITKKEIKVLIYNEQTVTPITTNLENEAKAAGIPIVGVTETMPQAKHYQSWMLDEMNALSAALATTSRVQ